MLTIDQMRADVAAILKEDPSTIADDDNLIDLGLDSIRVMSLVHRWTNAGSQVKFAELAERPELGHWWTILSAKTD